MSRTKGYIYINGKTAYAGISEISPKAKIPCTFDLGEKYLKKVAFVMGSDLIAAGGETDSIEEDFEYIFPEFDE